MSLQIITYNINGIRAGISKGLVTWLGQTKPDIICFQEIKAMEDQVDPEPFEKLGYKLYWNPAVKKGYSGVATFSKKKPKNVEKGFGIPKYDMEGRMLRLDFDEFSLLNVYMPSGSSGDIRQDFKMQWLKDFYIYSKKLRKLFPNLLICGDFNICHKEIDIHNPKSNAKSSGFLPEERAWMTEFFKIGFKDAFRVCNDQPHQYTWWSYRLNARARNLGWRIDYHAVTNDLAPKINRSVILNQAKHSDHCPVSVELEIE